MADSRVRWGSPCERMYGRVLGCHSHWALKTLLEDLSEQPSHLLTSLSPLSTFALGESVWCRSETWRSSCRAANPLFQPHSTGAVSRSRRPIYQWFPTFLGPWPHFQTLTFCASTPTKIVCVQSTVPVIPMKRWPYLPYLPYLTCLLYMISSSFNFNTFTSRFPAPVRLCWAHQVTGN